MEYNLVRPYTYSHWNSSSYGHYAQPLAHPLGANFDEFIVKLDYYYQRFSVNFKYNFARVGLDDFENINISYGNDIFLDYNLMLKKLGSYHYQWSSKFYDFWLKSKRNNN